MVSLWLLLIKKKNDLFRNRVNNSESTMVYIILFAAIVHNFVINIRYNNIYLIKNFKLNFYIIRFKLILVLYAQNNELCLFIIYILFSILILFFL